jgi:hypothetical protein
MTPEQMTEFNRQRNAKIAAYASTRQISIEQAKFELTSPVKLKPSDITGEKQSTIDMKPIPKKVRKRKRPKLRLISKRGTRIAERRACDRCAKSFAMTWRYAESTRGTVHLCTACKGKVPRPRSQKKIDALDRAYTGGRFEGNRSRH